MKIKSRVKSFFKNKRNKKIFIITTTAIIALLVITGTTFAYVNFTLNSEKENLIKTGCLKINIIDKNNIQLNSSLPMLDEKGLELVPYTYTLTNSCTVDAYYEANLGILNTSNSDNISKVKVSLAGDTYLYPTIIEALPYGTLLEDDNTISSLYLIDSGYLSAGESKSFDLRMWLTSDATDVVGALDAKVIVNAIAKSGPSFDSYTSGYKAIANTDMIEVTNTNPNFGYTSPYTDSNNKYSQTSGVFKVKESDNDVYYFRGNVLSNYVEFANLTWRIIKVNSDGSIKLILDDKLTDNVVYNSSSGSATSLSYSSSNIKTKLDSWYDTNLKSYENYIVNTSFCNDMTNSNNYYGGYLRNISSHSPSGVCTSPISLKIGTITVDELAYIGFTSESSNSDNYLSSSYNIWTMSPGYFSSNAYMISLDSNKISTVLTTESRYIRPVITLTSEAILTGNGTSTNKFHVIGLYGTDILTYSDTVIPVINYARVNVRGNIEISATDGAFGTGIGGYYISKSNSVPSLSDTSWINVNSEKYITSSIYENGTYYIWVKDEAGNISAVTTLEVSNDSKSISPSLTSNLVPVYYDETSNVWRKADSSNNSTNHEWYDYANKKWANAVTLYESGYVDESLNDRQITVYGATSSNDGLVFDGTDDSVSVYEDFGVTLPATYSVTFKTTDFSTKQIVFGDYSTKIALGFTGSGYLVTTIDNSRAVYSTSGLSNDTWYTMTVVANSSTNVELYINGVKQTETSSSDYWLWNDSSYIGAGNSSSSYFSGTIKNFMTWNRKLTKSEVSNLYNNSEYKSVSKDKLTTYFDFTNLKSRSYYTNSSAGTIIPMSMINSMWVWIPRFSATSNGSYNGGSVTSPGAFNISFVSINEKAHDAFTLGSTELSGFWVSKFEPSSDTVCVPSNNSIGTGCDLTTISPLVKPNLISLRGARVNTLYVIGSNMKKSGNIYGLSSSINTHMIKNNEWGAIAYLTLSLYGRCSSSTSCTDISINNCSTYKTGIAGDTIDASSSSTTCTDSNNKYNSEKGVLASSTGNIYGIYDLVGGSNEAVMGNYSSQISNSGFSSFPYSTYVNVYSTSSDYTLSGLQHALAETSGWFNNTTYFPSSSNTWIARSGTYSLGSASGLFYTSSAYTGNADIGTSTRYILVAN